jgi:hypothetical protein
MASHAACKIKIASETYGGFFNSIRFVDSAEQVESPNASEFGSLDSRLNAITPGNRALGSTALIDLSLLDGAAFHW